MIDCIKKEKIKRLYEQIDNATVTMADKAEFVKEIMKGIKAAKRKKKRHEQEVNNYVAEHIGKITKRMK